MPYKTTKRGRVIWIAQVMVDGFRRQKQCDTRAEALKWEAAEKERIQSPDKTPTVTDFLTLCNRYLDYVQPRVTKKVYDEKKSACQQALGEWGSLTADEVTPALVSEYLVAQARARSNNAANKDRKNLMALFNWGQKFLGLTTNPVRAVTPLPHRRARQYTPPQQDVLKVLAATTRTERVFLSCYLQTGARRTEIFRLTWDDINFSARTITLETRKTKGGEARRDSLPMTDELYRELKWWFGSPDRQFKDQPWVFVCDQPGPNYGRPFKVRRKFLAGLCKRAGVKAFGFHALRRYVASILADHEKVSSKVIQRILRHQSMATTERYVQRLNRDLRGTLDLLQTGEVEVNLEVKRSGKGVKNGVKFTST